MRREGARHGRHGTPTRVDGSVPTRRGVPYRAAAASRGLAVVLYAAALLIVAVTTIPPNSGGVRMLEYVHAHRTIYIVRKVLPSAQSLFLMVVFLALAVALRHLGKAFAAIAGLIGEVSIARPRTGDGSLALVLLSDEYAAAATAARVSPLRRPR
jgi:hypothetical protein